MIEPIPGAVPERQVEALLWLSDSMLYCNIWLKKGKKRKKNHARCNIYVYLLYLCREYIYIVIEINKKHKSMKRLVLLLGLFCLMSVYGLSQNYYDDLYYIPDSDDEISENIQSDDSQTVETEDSRDAVTETGADVDYDSSGMAVDVDAYNRRYDADDTRTVAAAAETGSGTDVKKSAGEYSYADRNEDEGWVDGFSGSVDD